MKQVVDLSHVDANVAAMMAGNAEKLSGMPTNELNKLAEKRGYKDKAKRKNLLVWLRNEAGRCIS